jgi:UDP-GlcNAc:undecaprenyl-phosphate GlcNAc-1-phosphate transferase
MGLSQREAVMAIYLICGALGVLAIFLTQASIVEGYVIGGAALLAGLLGLWRLEKQGLGNQ